ncbi:RxLR effector protein, partial [Phytophthora megakarya]
MSYFSIVLLAVMACVATIISKTAAAYPPKVHSIADKYGSDLPTRFLRSYEMKDSRNNEERGIAVFDKVLRAMEATKVRSE